MQIVRHDAGVEALRNTPNIFVLIERPEDNSGLDLVDLDFKETAYLAIKRLVDLGHKVIGCLDLAVQDHAGDLGYAFYMQQRFEMAQRNFDMSLVRRIVGRGNQDSYEATETLISCESKLSPILVLFGSTYPGVLRAIHGSGNRVPNDFAVICLESSTAANCMMPSLSTIDCQLADIGRIAAKPLLERIE